MQLFRLSTCLIVSSLLVAGCGGKASTDAGEDSAAPTVVDEDEDGVPAEEDCDDANAELGAVSADEDCDGALTADDCDDLDATLGAISSDADCDRALTEEDCDDSDPALNLEDADADGASTCDGDCNDADATITPDAEDTVGDDVDQTCDGLDGVDADGDGWASVESGGEDCDDTDAAVDPADVDADGYSSCDGDCDDTNGALNLDDTDMDGYTTCDGDCDDAIAELNLDDLDADTYTTCDGDCDDTNAALNLDDADADGYSTCDGDCDDTLDTLVDCTSCSDILNSDPNSPDGLYDINYGDGDVEVYCDMSGGGDTIENFGFGKYTDSYSGWELMDHNEFTEFAISDAMSHFYNQNGGLENIDVGFNSGNCCIVSADRSSNPYYGFAGFSYMYPANTDGSVNCNSTYNDSYLLLGDFDGGTGAFMTLSQSEVQNVNTFGGCGLSGNPGIFIQRWR